MFRSFSLNIKGRTWTAKRPVIAGIINVTPDSFYAESRVGSVRQTLKQAEQFIDEGALWLDIGGCSTRPGAAFPSFEEEWQRVGPHISELAKAFPEVPLSIDTFRSGIARRALDLGVDIINDVSGGSMDSSIWNVAAEFNAPYVLTHFPKSKTAQTMMVDPIEAQEVWSNISFFFDEKINALGRSGVKQILLDPGVGFGKTVEANFEIVRNGQQMLRYPFPFYLGISRKSFMWKPLGISANESLALTSALHLKSLECGAQILRVHDVKEATHVSQIWESLYRFNGNPLRET